MQTLNKPIFFLTQHPVIHVSAPHYIPLAHDVRQLSPNELATLLYYSCLLLCERSSRRLPPSSRRRLRLRPPSSSYSASFARRASAARASSIRVACEALSGMACRTDSQRREPPPPCSMYRASRVSTDQAEGRSAGSRAVHCAAIS